MADLATRITAHADSLPPAQRRVAEAVLADRPAAAFSTVAAVGQRAGTSGATVVRLADRLGYGGWLGLQRALRSEIDQQLRPAAQRIRDTAPHDVLSLTAAREADNIHRTLDGVDRAAFDRAVARLADRARTVRILAGTAQAGIGALLADALDLLRPGVVRIDGSPVAVATALARTERTDVLVAVDLRRYERWVLEAARTTADRGATVLAITDGRLSPLGRVASESFVVAAEGAGPFDSHVGTLALANALVSGVATALRRSATDRLDRVESAWQEADVLADR
jgi:DNA-binding MurR/RpiR family transcriptional regulator